MTIDRRAFGLTIFTALFSGEAFAQGLIYRFDSPLYRGFSIDAFRIQDASRREEILASVRKQIDLVVDCGAKPEIIAFFQGQKIHLRPAAGDGGGLFRPEQQGVTLSPNVFAPDKPVLLHELLHAYQARVMPGGFRNPDVLKFYNEAKSGKGYNAGAFFLKDPREFFAVTASLYLTGKVDQPPATRQRLKTVQPAYYAWLGDLLGVQK
jgi:hypothetical protein